MNYLNCCQNYQQVGAHEESVHSSRTKYKSIWIAFSLISVCTFCIFVTFLFWVSGTNSKSSLVPTSAFDNLYNLLVQSTGPDSPTLYAKIGSNAIFSKIPLAWVDTNQTFLFVEQITHGVGLRDLWWDPGNILSQQAFSFSKTSDGSRLILTAPNLLYRDSNGTSIRNSFACSILHSFEIITEDNVGFLVRLDDFFLGPVDGSGSQDLASVIATTYGVKYQYHIDPNRSAINTIACKLSSTQLSLQVTLTYALSETSQFAPASLAAFLPSSTSITVGLRRSIVTLPSVKRRNNNSAATTSFLPRLYHPESGFNLIAYFNESAMLLEPRDRQYIVRHYLPTPAATADSGVQQSPDKISDQMNDGGSLRVSVGDGAAAISQDPTLGACDNANNFLLYLIDSSAPEPIRSALAEGASWWDEAFQYAGYPKNTFRVAIADPSYDQYDLTTVPPGYCSPQNGSPPQQPPRVHFVQWINRDKRSYSVGQRVIDPRTGQIIRGHVRIESLRMRQDALIGEVLLGPYDAGTGPLGDIDSSMRDTGMHGRSVAADVAANAQEDKVEPSSHDSAPAQLRQLLNSETPATVSDAIMGAILQRVKQLGAHEVGHSLGLAHNFAGSTYLGGAASVMDYPPPLVTVDEIGNLILNNRSYANGIGFFDKVSIDFAYRQIFQLPVDESISVGSTFTESEPISPLDSNTIPASSTSIHAAAATAAATVPVTLSAIATTSLDAAANPETASRTAPTFLTSADLTESQEYDLLTQRLEAAQAAGYVFLTDQDADTTSADWRATKWDAGSNPVRALNTTLRVRAAALARLAVLSDDSVPYRYPLSYLQQLLPIVYFWHRYEVEATVKLVGGRSYQQSVHTRSSRSSSRSSSSSSTVLPVPAEMQLAAIDQLLEALHPTQLAVPSTLLDGVLPTAFGYTTVLGGDEDLLPSRLGGFVDAVAVAEAGASLVVGMLFTGSRLERLASQPYALTDAAPTKKSQIKLPGLAYTMRRFTDAVVLGPLSCITQNKSCVDVISSSSVVNNSSSSGSRCASVVAYPLQVMAAQSVLINAYMRIAYGTSSGSYSAIVRAQVTAHIGEISAAVARVAQLVDGSSCDEAWLWAAHLSQLVTGIASKNAWMVVPLVPLGPPI